MPGRCASLFERRDELANELLAPCELLVHRRDDTRAFAELVLEAFRLGGVPVGFSLVRASSSALSVAIWSSRSSIPCSALTRRRSRDGERLLRARDDGLELAGTRDRGNRARRERSSTSDACSGATTRYPPTASRARCSSSCAARSSARSCIAANAVATSCIAGVGLARSRPRRRRYRRTSRLAIAGDLHDGVRIEERGLAPGSDDEDARRLGVDEARVDADGEVVTGAELGEDDAGERENARHRHALELEREEIVELGVFDGGRRRARERAVVRDRASRGPARPIATTAPRGSTTRRRRTIAAEASGRDADVRDHDEVEGAVADVELVARACERRRHAAPHPRCARHARGSGS